MPAAQLVDTYDQHAQRMTGTGGIAHSSTVSAASASTEPQLYYIHTDHLGTPQELTDRSGNLQWVGHYRAWEELVKANDSEGNATNVEMPLRFQGRYCDAETGLHYNRFRYYDPQLARFTTQDPISLAGGINLYQYAPNPVGWIDPTGLTSKQLATAMVNAGEPCPINSAAHHIVGETSKGAAPARDVLNKHDIDINGADNGVFLPNRKNTDPSVPGILHNGRHPNDYLDAVNDKIQDADKLGGKEGVLNTLSDLKQTLLSADRNSSWYTVIR